MSPTTTNHNLCFLSSYPYFAWKVCIYMKKRSNLNVIQTDSNVCDIFLPCHRWTETPKKKNNNRQYCLIQPWKKTTISHTGSIGCMHWAIRDYHLLTLHSVECVSYTRFIVFNFKWAHLFQIYLLLFFAQFFRMGFVVWSAQLFLSTWDGVVVIAVGICFDLFVKTS